MKFVHIEATGGERGRMVAFCKAIGAPPSGLMCFADADWDRLFCRAPPPAMTLTDHRDLEAYIFQRDTVRRALVGGLGLDDADEGEFLDGTMDICRRVASVRILSERESREWPFQRTLVAGSLTFDRRRKTVSFDRDGYVRRLIQNDRRKTLTVADVPAVMSRVRDVDREFSGASSSDLVHGKDALIVAEYVSQRRYQAPPGAFSAALWASFERRSVEGFRNLAAVVTLLT
jgi:hypothetical protein